MESSDLFLKVNVRFPTVVVEYLDKTNPTSLILISVKLKLIPTLVVTPNQSLPKFINPAEPPLRFNGLSKIVAETKGKKVKTKSKSRILSFFFDYFD
jgi:hypothetical protein